MKMRKSRLKNPGKLLGITLASAIVCLSTQAPAAGLACGDRTSLLTALADKYKEATVAVGVTNSGGLVEVLSSGDGQTWTIIVSSPEGLTCLLATGEGWRAIYADPAALDPKV